MNVSNKRPPISSPCGDPGFLECHLAVWIWKTVPFFLIAVGTCGNMLCLIVLTRKAMRKFPTTIYLIALASSDIGVLWTALLRNALLRAADIDMKIASEFNCVLHEYSGIVFTYFSSLLIVLLTIERVLYTRFPVSSKRFLTRRNTIITAGVTLIFICLFNIHFLLGSRLTLVSYTSEIGNQTITSTDIICSVIHGPAGKWHFTWAMVAVPLFGFVPYIIVFSGNLYIGVTLFLRRRRVQPTGTTSTSTTDSNRKSATRLLLTIAIFFMLSSLPYRVFFFIYNYATDSVTPRQFARVQLIYAIFLMLWFTNFSFNFFLYFTGGTLFKREWSSLKLDVRNKLERLLGRQITARNDTGTTEQNTVETL